MQPAPAAPSRMPLRIGVSTVLVLFAASAVALLAAPSVMPRGYSWTRHVVSDMASQGVDGAWLARAGFVASALAILLLAVLSRLEWSRAARTLHTLYAAAILLLVVFSRRPWTGGRYNALENNVHSALAIIAGVLFALGIIVVAWNRPLRSRMRVVDAAVVLSLIVLPLLMLGAESIAGVTERIMVALGFMWYAVEVVRR